MALRLGEVRLRVLLFNFSKFIKYISMIFTLNWFPPISVIYQGILHQNMSLKQNPPMLKSSSVPCPLWTLLFVDFCTLSKAPSESLSSVRLENSSVFLIHNKEKKKKEHGLKSILAHLTHLFQLVPLCQLIPSRTSKQTWLSLPRQIKQLARTHISCSYSTYWF